MPSSAILPEVSFAPASLRKNFRNSGASPEAGEQQAGEAGITPSSVESPETPAAAAEPALIEVWRTGRPSGTRNRRDANKRRHRPDQAAAQPQAAPADGEAVAASAETPAAAGDATPSPDGERKRHGRPRHRRDRDREGRRTAINRVRRSAPSEKRGRNSSVPAAVIAPIVHRVAIVRTGRRAANDRDRDRDSNRPGRIWSSDNDRRGKEADPNSPFAKLLALKEQLEANKER